MTQQLLIWLERDENGFLHSVTPVPELATSRILVTVDAPDEVDYELSDPTEEEFMALQMQTFTDWADPAEDLYTWDDGEPLDQSKPSSDDAK